MHEKLSELDHALQTLKEQQKSSTLRNKNLTFHQKNKTAAS